MFIEILIILNKHRKIENGWSVIEAVTSENEHFLGYLSQ